MSAIHYTPLQLQRLSGDELRQIIIEQGWRPQPVPTPKTDLVSYIANMQDGRSRSHLLPNFSLGVAMGPIEETAGQVTDFYDQKNKIVTQLLSLSDAALFAVVDRLGHNLILSPPYVRVEGIQLDDRYSLVWYLIGVRSS
jgi:hypothetical protein